MRPKEFIGISCVIPLKYSTSQKKSCFSQIGKSLICVGMLEPYMCINFSAIRVLFITYRCPTFPVQSNCFMVPSQTDDCCRVQYCPPPTPGTTLVPNPEQSTTVPLIPIPQPSGEVLHIVHKTYVAQVF